MEKTGLKFCCKSQWDRKEIFMSYVQLQGSSKNLEEH